MGVIAASLQTKDDLTSLTSITQQISDWAGPTEASAFEESYFLNHVCRPLLEGRVTVEGLVTDTIINKQTKKTLADADVADWIFNTTIGDLYAYE